MNEPMKKGSSCEVENRRQLEVEQCLTDHGLVRRGLRLLRNSNATHEDDRCRRLTAALASLGPVFSSFGIYLSSRADLLPAKDCLDLWAISDTAAASADEAVSGAIEWFGPQSEAFAEFDEEPFESRLLFQSHRARLNSGEVVTVKIAHPELEEHLDRELQLLPLLSRALPELPLESVVEDFRCMVKQQLDFVRVAETMTELADETAAFGPLKAPRAHLKFCSPRVLTFDHLAGSNLEDLIPPLDDHGNEAGRTATPRSPREAIDFSKLANRLTLAWLRQALQGSVFSVDPRPDHTLLLESQQIALVGGGLATLPLDVKANLYEYLVAVVNQDGDKACSSLLKEMDRVKGAVSEDEFRNRLRQVIPYRDGGWANTRENPGLAESLFVQWRVARECGYRIRPISLSFFRGLFQVAVTARRLVPGRDVLLQSLQDLRMETTFAQFRELMSPDQLGDNLDKYAAILTNFPPRLNDVLTLMAEGNSPLSRTNEKNSPPRASDNPTAKVLGLVLLLLAVALLSRHLSVSTGAKVYIDSSGAILFLLVGALLLRVACRT